MPIRRLAPSLGLFGALALIGLAMALPAFTGWNVHVMSFPPLHADWDPRVGIGTAPAVLLALLGVAYAAPLAERLTWRRLMLLTYVAGVAWLFALAFVDGPDGIGHILDTSYEYLRTARSTHDIHATLSEYVSRIPYDAPKGNWPVHIAGHPPGALLFFVGLVRLGLGSGMAAGVVVTLIAASTAVAVLACLRVLGAESVARRGAPFLVFGPAAVWQVVSADAMFAAVAAWGLCALAVAAVRRSALWSILAGLLLGYCVMLSYGLALLAFLALAILFLARSWYPLLWAVGAAAAVVLTFAAFGFQWWEALPALHQRYWDGVASRRPAAYWMWGNLAALAISAGPMLGAGLANLAHRSKPVEASQTAVPKQAEPLQGEGYRVVRWLAGAAVLTILAADASQMSRAEVERIWLPFVPWLLLSCALLPKRWRQVGIAVQVISALLVQHLLVTGW